MFSSGLLNKVRNLTLSAVALSLSSFCRANDFSTHLTYNDFKNKTMQTYGLSSQQIDSAMFGSRNLCKYYQYHE